MANKHLPVGEEHPIGKVPHCSCEFALGVYSTQSHGPSGGVPHWTSQGGQKADLKKRASSYHPRPSHPNPPPPPQACRDDSQGRVQHETCRVASQVQMAVRWYNIGLGAKKKTYNTVTPRRLLSLHINRRNGVVVEVYDQIANTLRHHMKTVLEFDEWTGFARKCHECAKHQSLDDNPVDEVTL